MKSKAWIGLVVAMVLCAMPAGAQDFLGDQFGLSNASDVRLRTPSVGFFDGGGMVAVWEENTAGIVARTFDAQGQPQGAELLLVADDPVERPLPFEGIVAEHSNAQVVPADNGAFVAVWTRETVDLSVDIFIVQRDVLSQEIFAQRFEQGGTPVGSPVRISAAGGFGTRPAATRLTDGSILVAWEDGERESDRRVLARRLDAVAQPLGDAFVVGDGRRADLGALPNGGFLVTWDGCCDAGDDLGVFARSYDGSNAPLGAAQVVNDTTAGDQGAAQVATAPNGAALVTWQARVLDPEDGKFHVHVFTRPLAASGMVTGLQRNLTEDVAGDDHSGATVTALEGQGFLVVWMGWANDVRYGVLGARLNATGVGGDAFQISQQPIGGQFQLGLASGGGRALAAWEGRIALGERGIGGRLLSAETGPSVGFCASIEGGLPLDLLASHSICSR